MPHFRIDYTLCGSATIFVDEEEIENVDSLIKGIEKIEWPEWLEKTLVDGVKEATVDDAMLTDDEPSYEDELDFERF